MQFPSQAHSRHVFSCDQLRVGDAPPDRRAEQTLKALHGVVAHIAVTEPESELPNIAMQVLGAGVVIDAVQPTLEQRFQCRSWLHRRAHTRQRNG